MRIFLSNFSPVKGFRFKYKTVKIQRPKYHIKIIKINKTNDNCVKVNDHSKKISQRIHPTFTVDNDREISESVNQSTDYRVNEMKVQMLSKNLHEQIFGNSKMNTIDRGQIKRFAFLFNVRNSNALLSV